MALFLYALKIPKYILIIDQYKVILWPVIPKIELSLSKRSPRKRIAIFVDASNKQSHQYTLKHIVHRFPFEQGSSAGGRAGVAGGGAARAREPARGQAPS